jgi:hypothetical protein
MVREQLLHHAVDQADGNCKLRALQSDFEMRANSFLSAQQRWSLRLDPAVQVFDMHVDLRDRAQRRRLRRSDLAEA